MHRVGLAWSCIVLVPRSHCGLSWCAFVLLERYSAQEHSGYPDRYSDRIFFVGVCLSLSGRFWPEVDGQLVQAIISVTDPKQLYAVNHGAQL